MSGEFPFVGYSQGRRTSMSYDGGRAAAHRRVEPFPLAIPDGVRRSHGRSAGDLQAVPAAREKFTKNTSEFVGSWIQ